MKHIITSAVQWECVHTGVLTSIGTLARVQIPEENRIKMEAFQFPEEI